MELESSSWSLIPLMESQCLHQRPRRRLDERIRPSTHAASAKPNPTWPIIFEAKLEVLFLRMRSLPGGNSPGETVRTFARVDQLINFHSLRNPHLIGLKTLPFFITKKTCLRVCMFSSGFS